MGNVWEPHWSTCFIRTKHNASQQRIIYFYTYTFSLDPTDSIIIRMPAFPTQHPFHPSLNNFPHLFIGMCTQNPNITKLLHCSKQWLLFWKLKPRYLFVSDANPVEAQCHTWDLSHTEESVFWKRNVINISFLNFCQPISISCVVHPKCGRLGRQLQLQLF